MEVALTSVAVLVLKMKNVRLIQKFALVDTEDTKLISEVQLNAIFIVVRNVL